MTCFYATSLENLLHAENVAQKKANSDEHFDRSFSFMAMKGQPRNQPQQIRKQKL